jgi:hypothetical protein
MQLYALTYTDPSEPWGYAIEGRKLYRTPTEVVDAANAHFEAWCYELITAWISHDVHPTLPRWRAAMLRIEQCPANYAGRSLDQVLTDEWSHEYGFGLYEVA